MNIGEKLIDLLSESCVFDGFNPRKFIGKPGKFLKMILNVDKELEEKIKSLTAKDLNHPWYAKFLIGVEDKFLEAARWDKEQEEIVKKVRR